MKFLFFGVYFALTTSIIGQTNLKFNQSVSDEGAPIIEFKVLEDGKWYVIDEIIDDGSQDYIAYNKLPITKIIMEKINDISKVEIIRTVHFEDECFYIYHTYGDGDFSVLKACGDSTSDDKYISEMIYDSADGEIND